MENTCETIDTQAQDGGCKDSCVLWGEIQWFLLLVTSIF